MANFIGVIRGRCCIWISDRIWSVCCKVTFKVAIQDLSTYRCSLKCA